MVRGRVSAATAVGILGAFAPSFTARGLAEAACLPSAVPPESRALIEGLDGNSSVPFGIWVLDWDSAHLVSRVVKVLAEEVLGYNSTISGVGASSSSGLYATAGCRAPNDFPTDPLCSGSPDFDHHACLEMWGVAKIATMREALARWPEVIPEDAGDLGYEGVDGPYIFAQQRQEAYSAEGLHLEYYGSYDAAWHRPSAYFDNYTSFDLEELKPCEETRLMHTAAVRNYLRVTGDLDGVAQTSSGSLSARCWHGSWWFAPACRSSPELCVPFVTGSNGWFTEDAMQKAALHNMPLAIAVAKTNLLWRSLPSKRRVLPYWWQPDAAFLEREPTIVAFPPHNPSERAQNIRTSASAATRLSKWLHNHLRVRASRLRELVLRVSFTMDSIGWMLLENKKRGGSAYEEVACDWIRKSEHVWRGWIPVRTECPPGKGLVSNGGLFVESLANASDCAWCRPGRSSVLLANSGGRTTHVCARCAPGRGQPDLAQAECSPCSAGTFSDVNGSLHCQSCGFGEYGGSSGRSSCDACPASFITNFRGATSVEDCICPEGSYRDRDRRDACLPCEEKHKRQREKRKFAKAKEGMTCPEGSDALGYSPQHAAQHPIVPLLRPGFWASGREPLSLIRCDDTVRCPGGKVPGQACAEKFESQGCAACEAGLVLSGTRCVPCAVGALQILLFPVLPCAATMVIIIGLYWSSGQPYEKWGSWPKGVAAAIFIMLNFYHVVSVIHGLGAMTDGSSSSALESASVLSDLLSLFKPQCSGFRSFMSQLILNSHGPGLLLAVFVIIWLLSLLLGRCHEALRMEWNRLINTYFSLIVTFFTRIADMSFTIFKCTDNPNGSYTLVRDRSIICFEGDWNGMVAIGALAVLLWCVGLGAVLVYDIYAAPQRFHEDGFQTRCAFLFVRYRPDVHWWSLVIVAKGVLLNVGSLFIPSGAAQIYWILVVLLAYTYATVTFRPWRHLLNNSVDTFVHLCLCLTCATSIWLVAVGSSREQIGLIVHLLRANLATAVLPLIPVAVRMWWNDRSRSAQEKKDTDARLFLSTLGLVSQGDYHEQLEFLKLLTEHDFQLMRQTKDMLLMERGAKKVRAGYTTRAITSLSRDDLDRWRRSLGMETVDYQGSSFANAARCDSFASGADAAPSNSGEQEHDNDDELSTFSF